MCTEPRTQTSPLAPDRGDASACTLPEQEMTIALEEWLRRVPSFSLAEPPGPVLGGILCPTGVGLKWDDWNPGIGWILKSPVAGVCCGRL